MMPNQPLPFFGERPYEGMRMQAAYGSMQPTTTNQYAMPQNVNHANFESMIHNQQRGETT